MNIIYIFWSILLSSIHHTHLLLKCKNLLQFLSTLHRFQAKTENIRTRNACGLLLPKLGTRRFWHRIFKAQVLSHPWQHRYKFVITGQKMSYSLTWKKKLRSHKLYIFNTRLSKLGIHFSGTHCIYVLNLFFSFPYT